MYSKEDKGRRLMDDERRQSVSTICEYRVALLLLLLLLPLTIGTQTQTQERAISNPLGESKDCTQRVWRAAAAYRDRNHARLFFFGL